MDIEIAWPAQGWERESVLTPRQGWKVARYSGKEARTQAQCLECCVGSSDRPEADTRQVGCAQALIVICAGGERKRDVRIALAMQKGHHLILQCRILLVRATAAGRRRMGSVYLGIIVCVCVYVCIPSYFPRKVRPGVRSAIVEDRALRGGGDCSAAAVRACGRLGSADRSLFPIAVVS